MPVINSQQLTISTKSVLKVIALIIGLLFLWQIQKIIGMVFTAMVLASAIDPWVDNLARHHIPRWLTITGMYVVFFSVIIFTISLIIPPLTVQISEIGQSLKLSAPQIEDFFQNLTGAEDANLMSQLQRSLANINATLTNITTGFVGAVRGFVGKISTVIIVLVMTFYITVEEDGVKKFIRSVAPVKYQPYLSQKANRIQTKLGAWLRGQLIVMVIIGVMSFVSLSILQVPYALVLAIIAGLLEFVPFIGPVIASIPAIFFAYFDSPWKAVGVIIIYVVIQQVENQLIVPRVMKRAVGLNPLVVITVMLMGAQFAGLVGIIFAVPAATIAWIFLEDFFAQKKERDNKLAEPRNE